MKQSRQLAKKGFSGIMKGIGVLSLLAVTPTLLFADTGASPAVPSEPVRVAIGKEQNMWQTLIMISVALIFFYFILWRPEQKRKKAQEKLRNSLQKGDRVTVMGILGTVARVNESTVILKLYDGAKVEVLKAAITDVQPSVEEHPAKEESKG